LHLVVDQTKCDGCRLCELVCSLRMHGEFNPARSAVRILKYEKRGIYIPVISPYGGLLLDDDDYPLVCDLCGGRPRCVDVCPAGAIRIEETGG
jgi:carbon-monoxide dehydrogenase iron sulfur subunit